MGWFCRYSQVVVKLIFIKIKTNGGRIFTNQYFEYICTRKAKKSCICKDTNKVMLIVFAKIEVTA